ncbi:polysaccharide pyruvyl transferase family protein [Zobellia sp. B3R18]|uniref:polysaccharide pyruvyl transferase family protein n=1 Tax=Zobellia sp. B3R18 TaxID=2841568 RepID=UPI001C074B10|nr:polysaccharide pyruvyl transferase family protein [Zobellia sp. B3R18]MBU2974888.1 polysaccharide pyruvyl transferase family protein [Zobellia sp. B3R18]
MIKKIGLLTLPLKHNYGGIIQIAALKSYLENQGFETVFLDKHYSISALRATLRTISLKNPFYKIFDYKDNAKRDRYLSNLHKFVAKELAPATKAIYNQAELKSVVENLNLDAIIVGSDQVWRMSFIQKNYQDYFLGFLEGNSVKKIAYAASFGDSKWTANNVVEDITTLLNNFDAISVREDSGLSICEKVFAKPNVNHVLDPTFLPNIDYYERIIKDEFTGKKDVGLFNYVLDKSPQKKVIINTIAQQLDLGIDSLYLDNNLDDFKTNKTLKPSMGEWLYHFKNAEFVVTDSFHGTVFSILFNKPFIAIGNTSRGLTRFTSLLNQLKLSDRLILDWDERQIEIINTKIDYESVNNLLKGLKDVSRLFLRNALTPVATNE